MKKIIIGILLIAHSLFAIDTQTYLNQNEEYFMKTLKEKILTFEETFKINEECKEKDEMIITTGNVLVINPLKFENKTKNVLEGTILLNTMRDNCENRHFYNIIFNANGKETLEYVSMYPGVTKTTPNLMASVLLEAHSKVLMMIKNKQCNDGIILNMEVINDLDVYTNTWRERWTFLACEEIVELLIKFKYDPKVNNGASYVIN